MKAPFWEDGYRDLSAPGVFGPPSQEIVALAQQLPANARALDLGCGDERNALYLLDQGLRVTAVDVSSNAVAKVAVRGQRYGDRLTVAREDIRTYEITGRRTNS